MALASQTLSLAEFDAQYAQAKPHYEFWYGEAIQKSMPTWIHGLLQRMLMELLSQVGYIAASEVKLKIDPDFQPVPDIIATKKTIHKLYPTEPLEIVIEILSEDDPMSRVLTKCRTYERWGFEQIYVVDPATRLTYLWNNHRLEEVNTIANQSTEAIWTSLPATEPKVS